ncbi:MAG: class I SAM-dependent rRNA methyltransferase [Deltaproteobacteria bacterium]|nr:class I SAM-dependent rRNA methyltransferase [Deltaproteobacteria bacterium]
MLIIQLKPKKEFPVIKGHPWIFSGAVDNVQGSPEEKPGLCRVIDSSGKFVCQGFYSPFSQIAVRVLTCGKERVDREFLRQRIMRSIELRKQIISGDTTCFRLVHSEGDGIPGLIADIYKDVLVMQFLCAGIEDFKDEVVNIFRDIYPQCMIHERSDLKSRNSEGLRPLSGPLHGELSNGEIEVAESGIPFMVDVLTGEKTGFFLDHRHNRQRFGSMASGKDVLDLFSYTGSFSVYAVKGGAKSVVSVDNSSPAQALLKKNMEINQIKPFVWKHVRDDVVRFLSDDRAMYDLIVCDPPSFSRDFEEYTKINALAMARLKPGGILFTTGIIHSQFNSTDMIKAINWASERASRSARILEPLYQAPDFPVLTSHVQGGHLCGYILYVE